jgi:hypothetical protein
MLSLGAGALRLIRALAVEIHENWIEAHRYLNMEMLREQRKQLQLLEATSPPAFVKKPSPFPQPFTRSSFLLNLTQTTDMVCLKGLSSATFVNT